VSITAEAKALMNNEAFVEALESCRKQAMNAALACGIDNDEGRRRYLDAVRTVDKVQGHLAALISADTPEEVNPADFYEERAKRRFAFLGK
jgi:hypothetical protein